MRDKGPLGNTFYPTAEFLVTYTEGMQRPLILKRIVATMAFAMVAFFGAQPAVAADRGRVQVVSNSVLTDTGTLLRGAKVEAWKALNASLATQYQDPLWWDHISGAGANAVRIICFDPAQKTNGWSYSQLGNYGDPTAWASLTPDAQNLLTLIDAEVNLASTHGMYALINYHDPGAHPDMNYWQRFWELVAPRYAGRTHVLYELCNEPIPQGDPVQYWPAHWFGSLAAYQGQYLPASNPTTVGQYGVNMIADQFTVYQEVRAAAPLTHLVLFSFPNSYAYSYTAVSMRNVVQQSSGINWSNASVGFHPYHTGNSSAPILDLKSQYPVLCSEANFPENVQSGGMDGEAYSIQTLERLGLSWFVWMVDPPGTPAVGTNYFDTNWINRILPDASSKLYWWQAVNYPNGGELLTQGLSINATWDSESMGHGPVDLAISTNGGSTWSTVATGLPNTGSGAFTVPNTPSTTCRLRVMSNGGKAYDISDADFSITFSFVTATDTATRTPTPSISATSTRTPTSTVTPTRTATPSITASPTPIGFYIWDDFELGSSANLFAYAGNGATVTAWDNSGAAAAIQAGSRGGVLTVNTASGSAYDGAYDLSPYDGGLGYRDLTGATFVDLWVKASAANAKLTLRVEEMGNTTTAFSGADGEEWYSSEINLGPAATWVHLQVPVSAFTVPVWETVHGDNVMDVQAIKAFFLLPSVGQGTLTFDVDSIRFLTALAAPSATVTVTPSPTLTPYPFTPQAFLYDDFESGVLGNHYTYADSPNGATLTAWSNSATAAQSGSRGGLVTYNSGNASSWGAGFGEFSPATGNQVFETSNPVSVSFWVKGSAGLVMAMRLQEAGSAATPFKGADGEDWISPNFTLSDGNWHQVTFLIGQFLFYPYAGEQAGAKAFDLNEVTDLSFTILGNQGSGTLNVDNIAINARPLTATPTFSSSATRSTTPSSTATRTPSPTPSTTPTSSASRTPSSSATPTSSASPSRTASSTGTSTASATPSGTISPTYTASPLVTATPTPTISTTWSVSPTYSVSHTATASPSATMTPTISVTSTASLTETFSPSVTLSATGTVTSSQTSSGTITGTKTPSASPSGTPTSTATATQSPVLSATSTGTLSPCFSSTATRTVSPVVSSTATGTVTATSTASPVASIGATAVPSQGGVVQGNGASPDIQRVVAVPNPSLPSTLAPQVAFYLKGDAEEVRVLVYTRAMLKVGEARVAGNLAAGWRACPLPSEGLVSGSYFIKATAYRNRDAGKSAISTWQLLR